MPGPTIVGTPLVSTIATASGTPSWNTDQPRTAGHLLWFTVSMNRGSNVVPTLSASAGWTVLGSGIASGLDAGGVWIVYKNTVAAGSDAAPTLTFSTTCTWRAQGYEYDPTNLDLTAGIPEFSATVVNDTTSGAHTTSLASRTNSNSYDEWWFLAAGGRGNPSTATFTGGSASTVTAFGIASSSYSATGQDILTAGSSTTYGVTVGANGTAGPTTGIVGFAFKIKPANAFTGSAALSGTGALAASGLPNETGTAATSGSGALTATGTPAIPTPAGFSGSGSLSASGKPTPVQAAGFSGSGSLAASGVPAPTAAPQLSGSGALSATGAPGETGSAALTGTGILAAAETGMSAAGAAALTGDGALTTAAAVATSGVADLAGDGTLAASGGPALADSAVLMGDGELSATAEPGPTGQIGLTGDGVLTAGQDLIAVSGSASFSGDGSLALVSGYFAIVHFTGTGVLSAEAVVSLDGSAGLSGDGLLTLTVEPILGGGADLSGDGVLEAVGVAGLEQFADLTGDGQLTAAGLIEALGSALFSGSGSLEAVGVVTGLDTPFSACLAQDPMPYLLTLDLNGYVLTMVIPAVLEMEATVPDEIYSSAGDSDDVTGILTIDTGVSGKTFKVGLGTDPDAVAYVDPDVTEPIDDNNIRLGVNAGAGAYEPPVLGSAVRLWVRIFASGGRQRSVKAMNDTVTFL